MLIPIISFAAVMKRLREFPRNRDGSAAVEFAMIAPMFFALIFAVMETGMVFMAGQVLETGVEDGARLVYTSQTTSATDFKSVICGRVFGDAGLLETRYRCSLLRSRHDDHHC